MLQSIEDVETIPVVPPSSQSISSSDRLIVALDVSSVKAAEKVVEELDGVAHFFKVGLTLQLAPGVENLIKTLIDSKKKVFLDYKYYDIPETLKTAVSRAAQLGVSFLTVHGSSGLMRTAVEARGSADLQLFTVTVLTSMDADDLAELGYTATSVEELVLFRAKKALEAGCDGVIASGQEAFKIKEMCGAHESGKKLLVVSPGIRPDGHPEDDQKRKVTPRQAIISGADYLVLGRPITTPRSGDKRSAALEILGEMQAAFDSRVA